MCASAPRLYDPAVGTRLAAAFVTGWRGAGPVDEVALEAALAAALAGARAAWPAVEVDDAAVAAFVGERIEPAAEPVAALAGLQVAALYLTCGCARGQADALRAFDAAFLARAPAYLSRLSPTRAVVDEVQQLARERLLVGAAGAPPRIARYTGRGSLEGFVRVAVVRLASDLLDRQPSTAGAVDDDAPPEALLAIAHDRDRRYLQGRYAADVTAAFRAALAAMPARERGLLRLHYLERMTPARIGTVYGVHRTTVMRWLAAAEEAVLAATRAELGGRLGLSPSECDSLVALVRSRLELTLDSVLADEPPAR